MAYEEQIDRIIKPNQKGEISLPIAHYAIVNSKKKYKNYKTITIYGLGSCIAILLLDSINHIHAMSHVLLPTSKLKEDSQIKLPHKYVNTSIKDLLDKMIESGAELKNLKAIMIGGATIFDNEFNYIGQQNIRMARKLLNSLNIKILFEEVGGKKGRTIIYNIVDNLIKIKTSNGTITKKII